MKNIFLIRHCAAEGQSDDAELTPEGHRQSEVLSDFLQGRDIGLVVSSPSKRAVETIYPFARRNEIEIEFDERLMERKLSTQKMTDWLWCLEKTFLDRDLRYGGGETNNEAAARSHQVLDEMISGKFGTVALVTHGNLMALMLEKFDPSFGFREWANLSNPDVYLIRTDGSSHDVNRVWGQSRRE